VVVVNRFSFTPILLWFTLFFFHLTFSLVLFQGLARLKTFPESTTRSNKHQRTTTAQKYGPYTVGTFSILCNFPFFLKKKKEKIPRKIEKQFCYVFVFLPYVGESRHSRGFYRSRCCSWCCLCCQRLEDRATLPVPLSSSVKLYVKYKSNHFLMFRNKKKKNSFEK